MRYFQFLTLFIASLPAFAVPATAAFDPSLFGSSPPYVFFGAGYGYLAGTARGGAMQDARAGVHGFKFKSNKESRLQQSVARNSVVFADASALIEISNLASNEKYAEAFYLAKLQLQHIQIVRTWDKSSAMAKEEETFRKVKDVLWQKAYKTVPTQGEPVITDGMVNVAIKVGEKVVPGPWWLLLELFRVLL